MSVPQRSDSCPNATQSPRLSALHWKPWAGEAKLDSRAGAPPRRFLRNWPGVEAQTESADTTAETARRLERGHPQDHRSRSPGAGGVNRVAKNLQRPAE